MSILITALAAIPLLFFLLYERIRHRYDDFPPEGIAAFGSNNPDFEIVAVHGLGSNPETTWISKEDNYHLLRELLPDSFNKARIMRFAYRSKWLINASFKSPSKMGQDLLDELEKYHRKGLPIIFVGHSFGGIVIKQALCKASETSIIWDDTCGIIFLGTPHQGSPMSFPATALAYITTFFGSSSALIAALGARHSDLGDLEVEFRKWLDRRANKTEKVKIISVREIHHSYIFGFWSLGLIVDQQSALGAAVMTEDWPCSHTKLNKFSGPKDENYVKLKRYIQIIRKPSDLHKADTIIKEKYLKPGTLEIKRLSGTGLAVDAYYMNLGIVDVEKERNSTKDAATTRQPSQITLLERLSVHELDQDHQIEMSAVFEKRKTIDGGNIEPTKILIRGRAGVGKSTLCKKIVRDFTDDKLWKGTFDRIIWIPMRKMYNSRGPQKELNDVLIDEFFLHLNDSGRQQMLKALNESNKARTLFLLDGLDEVHHFLNEGNAARPALEVLLSKANVIVTSRPHLTIPRSLMIADMELEVMGFSPQQVEHYIRQVIPQSARAISTFLEKNQLIRDLVRVPIQLDALCYTWDDTWSEGEAPRTMTRLYQAIEIKLWNSHLQRRDRTGETWWHGASDYEIKGRSKQDAGFLELLAFSGLYLDTLDFNKEFYSRILEALGPGWPPEPETLDERLAWIPFLRSSNPTAESEFRGRTYHFIHLTFQEYFAARYFVKKWGAQYPLELFRPFGPSENIPTREFLQHHKYSPFYDIFWRFVAGLWKDPSVSLFQLLDDHRQDLIGPTHQRLVMHCLMEADEKMEERKNLEKRLRQWVVFECQQRQSARIVKEIEFPDHIAISLLETTGHEVQVEVLRSLADRATLSVPILQAIEPLLVSANSPISTIAGNILSKQHNLPLSIIQSALERMADSPPSLMAMHYINNSPGRVVASQRHNSKEIMDRVFTMKKHRNADIRLAVVKFFTEVEKPPEAVIDYFLHSHSDRVKEVREAVIEFVKRHGTVSSLLGTRWWRHGYEEIEAMAIKRLTNQAVIPDKVLSAVTEILRSRDRSTRSAAVDFFQAQHNLPDQILKGITRLLGKGYQDRHGACKALERRDDLPEIILRSIAKYLKDREQNVWWDATCVLVGQATLPDDVLQDIIDRLRNPGERWGDKDECTYSVRPGAITVSLVALPHITALLTSCADQEKVLLCVSDLLRTQKSFSPKALQDALLPFQHPRILHCRQVWVFENLDPLPDLAAEAIAVKLPIESCRDVASMILGKQRSLPLSALKSIVDHLRHDDNDVKLAAIVAIGGLKDIPVDVQEILRDLLRRGCDKIRERICRQIGSYGGSINWALRDIIERFEDDSGQVRSDAVHAFWRWRHKTLSCDALQVIMDLMSHHCESVQQTAIISLKGIQFEDPMIVQKLIQKFQDSSLEIKTAIIEVVQHQSPWTCDLISFMRDAVNDSNWIIQSKALASFGTFGPELLDKTTATTMSALAISLTGSNRLQVMKALQDKQIPSKEALLDMAKLLGREADNAEFESRLGSESDYSHYIWQSEHYVKSGNEKTHEKALRILKSQENLDPEVSKFLRLLSCDDSASILARCTALDVLCERKETLTQEFMQKLLDSTEEYGWHNVVRAIESFDLLPLPLVKQGLGSASSDVQQAVLRHFLDRSPDEDFSSLFMCHKATLNFLGALLYYSWKVTVSMYLAQSTKVCIKTQTRTRMVELKEDRILKRAIHEARNNYLSKKNGYGSELNCIWKDI